MFKLKHKNNSISENGKISVGFIVQMPEIWDKLEPIYESMVDNDRFEVALILAPQYDFKNECLIYSFTNNYFLEKYKDVIICNEEFSEEIAKL